jgi:hypothetical protein
MSRLSIPARDEAPAASQPILDAVHRQDIDFPVVRAAEAA